MARNKLGYTVDAASRGVLCVHMPVKKGFRQSFLVQSDEHWDNPKCDRRLLKRHHDEAVELGAGIIKVGDTFCAMQGKYDKRSSKSDIRPEHQSGNYLDRLVSTAADWYEPYAKNIVSIGDGNHETSIRDRHETDLNERLCASLSDRTGAHVHHGGYSGFVRFLFHRGTCRRSRVMWYMHGYGGGGPVTKDTIQFHRQMARLDGVDVIATGHTHDQWFVKDVKLVLSDSNRVEHRTVYGLKLGTYKEEYGEGSSGWHVQTGKPPKPLGAWWINFGWDYSKDQPTIDIREAGE